MRKILAIFYLFLATALVTVQSAQAANPDAGAIFDSIGGTTTIDRGGAIHSQARSIYSLGGGMTTFQGKRVSLLAADPPSFSAGCNGISWHFGGFAFISLDEIRQLVEAVAQASLGIAVDLAMQTLCPQCYAVMAKLRDISNMMRNAAADACRIAQDFGNMLKEKGVFTPLSRTSDCAKNQSDSAKTASWMDGVAGAACKMLDDAEKKLQEVGKNVSDFLQFGQTNNGTTPSREQLENIGNLTYKGLSALGYEDGVIKDLMLSILGMTVVHPVSAPDCRETFKNLIGSAQNFLDSSTLSDTERAAMQRMVNTPSAQTVTAADASAAPTSGDAKVNAAKAAPGGTTVGLTTCYAPPVLSGIQDVGKSLMCGLDMEADRARFAASYYGNNLAAVKASSLGSMCSTVANQDQVNPLVYHCAGNAKDCTEPQMMRLQTLLNSQSKNGYTGLAWMIGGALYDGVKAVRDNKDLEKSYPNTVKILNGSGWPLYRLLNMAAVYPTLAHDLVGAYASAIAAQYAMDTLDNLSRIGKQPAVDTKVNLGISPESVSVLRETIQNMVRMGDNARTQVLERLAEKRKLVAIIMEVNKALQAEVIGQGLSGNSNLAVSIKRQATKP